MRKIIWLCILILSISSLAAGCAGGKEMDKYSYVTVIGIDRGVNDKWRITFQMPNESGQENSESGTGKMPYENITIDAPSFFGAMDLANTNIPWELNFMHTKLIVISEDVAKSGTMDEILAPLVRYREIRRSVNVVVSKEEASEFVRAIKPYMGTLVTMSIENLIQEYRNTGYLASTRLADLYDSIKSTYQQPIIMYGAINNNDHFQEKGEKFQGDVKTAGSYYAGETPRKGGNPIEFLGLAVFDGEKMVGRLNGSETRDVLLLRDEYEQGIVTIPDPEKKGPIIPILVKPQKKNSIKIRFDGNHPIIDVGIKLEGDIYAIQSRINYESPELRPVLEKIVEKHVRESLLATIKKAKGLKTDVFGFGKTAVRYFLTIDEWKKYNWIEQFNHAEINIDVDFIIRRTGGLLKSSPIINTEGEE